jgi:hypothetical protein
MDMIDPSSTATGKSAPRRREITIFREASAPTLDESEMMEINNSEVATAGIAKLRDSGLDDGYVLKCLFRSPDADGFSLTYAWFKGNYPLPPHKHNTACLYYVISGEIHMGKEVLGAGDGFFLPAGAGYSYSAGPDGVEVVEFRDSSHFDIAIADASAASWERLAKICENNRELWKSQRPPVRIPQV